MEHSYQTTSYKIIADAGGYRYQFFCDVSGALVYTTKQLYADASAEQLEKAWNLEGKDQFNRCHRCGRWVSDVMYNADVLECVECTPWENAPNYCHHCGKKILESEEVCRRCGTRLRYEGGLQDG